MGGDLISGLAYEGQVKMPADRFGYVTSRYTFFPDTMIDGVSGGLFNGQHI